MCEEHADIRNIFAVESPTKVAQFSQSQIR